jgi:hypothetical protein
VERSCRSRHTEAYSALPETHLSAQERAIGMQDVARGFYILSSLTLLTTKKLSE